MKVVFDLPFGGVPAHLALTSSAEVAHKDFVLKLLFDAPFSGADEAQRLGMAYSSRLKSPYVYSANQSVGATVDLPTFRIPEGAKSLTVSSVAWEAKNTEAPYSAVLLRVQAPWAGHNKLTIVGEML